MSYAKIKINLPKSLVVLKLNDDSYSFYTDMNLEKVKKVSLNQSNTNLSLLVEDRVIQIKIINRNILKTDKEVYLLNNVKIKDLDKANVIKVKVIK